MSRVTIYSLHVLLSRFGTRQLFHVRFLLCFLTYIQVSWETGKVIWYSHLFKNFPQFAVFHTIKGFRIVSEAEVNVFLEVPCFLYDPWTIGNLISHSSAFSDPSLNIWKFLIHVLLKPCLKDFKHNLARMWNECSCMVVWTSFDIALLWNWNENWPFLVLWPLFSFPNLLIYWNNDFLSLLAIFCIQLGISLPFSLSFHFSPFLSYL